MIFKGFTDENGNVIPVQGAGTVYNEELNSLALGKDTVAVGQDQLVFGQKNVADANKVEIVGGGTTQGSSSIEKVYWRNEERGIQGYYLMQKVASTQEEFESYVKDLYNVDSVQHNTTSNTPNWNNMKGVYKYLSAHTGSDYRDIADYSNDDYRYWLIEADNKLVGVWTARYSNNDYAECIWLEGRITPTSIINGSYNNIRTLDWEGNEKLYGSLAIGEDTKTAYPGYSGQLVFGRNNVEDLDKVETVGGGVKIVIEGKVHISLYNDDKQRNARVVFSVPVDRANYDFDADVEVPTVLKNFANFDEKMAHLAKIESIKIEDGLENLYDFCYIGGPNYYEYLGKTGDLWYFVYAEKNNPSMWTGDQFDPIRGYTVSCVSSEQKRNIRTLDWQGNEELAGRLKVGKGITIGETSLTEEQLIALKALLNS